MTARRRGFGAMWCQVLLVLATLVTDAVAVALRSKSGSNHSDQAPQTLAAPAPLAAGAPGPPVAMDAARHLRGGLPASWKALAALATTAFPALEAASNMIVPPTGRNSTVASAASTASVVDLPFATLYPHTIAEAGFLLHSIGVALVIFAAALVVTCVYDILSRWHHWARFWACQAKVRRVHEVCNAKKFDFNLCPYCVECICSQRSPKKVQFLCGHRFHVECSNRWFLEHPDIPAACPVCTEADCHCKTGAFTTEAASPRDRSSGASSTLAAAPRETGENADGSMSFILKSLQKNYPEIVSEACAQRWMSCHTEIWLSELTCPRYVPILKWR